VFQGDLIKKTGKSGAISTIRIKFRRILPRHSVFQRGHCSGLGR
jgi:hypothetical protein